MKSVKVFAIVGSDCLSFFIFLVKCFNTVCFSFHACIQFLSDFVLSLLGDLVDSSFIGGPNF